MTLSTLLLSTVLILNTQKENVYTSALNSPREDRNQHSKLNMAVKLGGKVPTCFFMNEIINNCATRTEMHFTWKKHLYSS